MDRFQVRVGSRSRGGVRVRPGQTLIILATALLASLASGPMGATAAGSPSPAATGADPCAGLALTVVTGTESLTLEAAPAMAGIEMRSSDDPSPAESIVFVVSLADGPMPPLRERLTAIEGKPHGRAAILLTRADDVADPELHALLLLEVRELLASHGQPDADTMPAFLDNDPNIDLLLRGLAVSP